MLWNQGTWTNEFPLPTCQLVQKQPRLPTFQIIVFNEDVLPWYCWWKKSCTIWYGKYLQGFIYARWCRISAINSIASPMFQKPMPGFFAVGDKMTRELHVFQEWQVMWRLKKVTASWCVNTFQIRSVDLRKRSEEQKYAGFLSGISWTTFVVRGVVLCLIADRMHFALLLMARYILRAPLWCWFIIHIIPNLQGLSSVKQICSPLKINGLKINFPFGIAYFQRRTISFRGVSIYVSLNLHLFRWLTPLRIFQQKPPIIELMTCPGWPRPILSF